MSRATAFWSRIGTTMLPFADAASAELPLPRLLRLALFQISVGMAAVLLTATLNRVMIVELKISASLVALMVALPLLFAPLRAMIGHKSDHHRSMLGWRRVPYIWFGTLMQFGGFAILPFALLVMSGDTTGPVVIGEVAAAIAFLLVGAGMHMTQTAGLALATDLAPEASRPRVVALLYVMLLIGMLASSLLVGALLADFSPVKLVQVIQGAGALTMVLNVIALWKQEPRNSRLTAVASESDFRASWQRLTADAGTRRLLFAVGLGAAAFGMQDVLLEPYGGEVLRLTVGETTSLTALWSAGTLIGFMIAARMLGAHGDCYRLAAYGAVVGTFAFASVILSAPLHSIPLLALGVGAIGLGGGLFSVGTLTAAMTLARDHDAGLALGAWGAVQASAAGSAILLGGALRDGIGGLATSGALGATLNDPATGYTFVWHLEIGLLFATLIAIGPLVRSGLSNPTATRFGLSEFPT